MITEKKTVSFLKTRVGQVFFLCLFFFRKLFFKLITFFYRGSVG